MITWDGPEGGSGPVLDTWGEHPVRARRGRHRRARRAARHAARGGCPSLLLFWLAGWVIVAFMIWVVVSGGWQP